MSLGLSLMNTLQGVDVNTLQQALEAQQNQVVAEAAARAAAANQGAEQAGTAYQSASQAPPPALSALSQALPGLMGSVASIISGNPSYQQDAQQRTQISQKQLFENRQNTLTALRDKYLQQADAAKQIGNDAAHTESLVKLNQIENQQAQLLLKQKQDATSTEGIAKRADDLRKEAVDNVRGLMSNYITAGKDVPAPLMSKAIKLGIVDEGTLGGALKPTGGKGGSGQEIDPEALTFIDNEIKQNSAGKTYLPLTNIPVKYKASALQYAKDHNLPAVSPQESDRLDRLDIARQNVNSMIGSLRTFAPSDWKDVQKTIRNKAEDIAGSNPEIRNYHTYYEALIQQLVALAGGAGSGVRINQAEIKRLQETAPKVTTPLPVAERWAQRVQELVDNTEGTLLSRKRLMKPEAKTAPAPTTPKATVSDRAYVQSLGLSNGQPQ